MAARNSQLLQAQEDWFRKECDATRNFDWYYENYGKSKKQEYYRQNAEWIKRRQLEYYHRRKSYTEVYNRLFKPSGRLTLKQWIGQIMERDIVNGVYELESMNVYRRQIMIMANPDLFFTESGINQSAFDEYLPYTVYVRNRRGP